MRVFSSIQDLRQQRRSEGDLSWGLVPTMGFLHEGHLSLIRCARQENDRVGVSIFVNPAQFNDQHDLANYPRNLQRDLEMLEGEHADLVWTPAVEQVYPEDYQTYVDLEEVTQLLEGAARPGHFRGVATVVTKLFNVFEPERAYFGQKDAQQLVVIRQMVHDLNIPVEIVACPTIREADGLAMSSRNASLSEAARKQAICLFEALQNARAAIAKGELNAQAIKEQMLQVLGSFDQARVDYVSIADPKTLKEVSEIDAPVLISLAVFVGDIRLIDNLLVEPGGS